MDCPDLEATEVPSPNEEYISLCDQENLNNIRLIPLILRTIRATARPDGLETGVSIENPTTKMT